MEATLLLYSGRPNPRWQVPAEQARAIRKAIAGLAEAPPGVSAAGGLGYSGVSVRFSGEDGAVQEWTFADGLATPNGKWFADSGRRVERALLESGRGTVPEIASLDLANGM